MQIKTRSIYPVALLAAVISLIVYLRAVTFDFVNYDDPQYVLDNPAIRVFDWSFIKWAFSSAYMGWRMPFVWISFALDYQLWGMNPAGYHLTNILLHAVNTGLVVLLTSQVFRKLFGDTPEDGTPGYLYPGALLFAGLLFGIHPAHVESVAWITERKNVLSTLFILATLVSYLRYLQLGEISASLQSRSLAYLSSIGFLVLSLLTKPVAVMVPAILLVADWYPYNRLRQRGLMAVIVEKIPPFALAALVAVSAITSASGERILVPLSLFSLQDRLVLSGYAAFEHCMLLLAPVNIVVMYLIPMPLPLSYTIKAVIVLAITIVMLLQAGKRPWLLAAWSGLLLPMLPSLHFFINGACSISSHFVYLPAILPGVALAALLYSLQKRLSAAPSPMLRLVLPALALSLLLFYLFEQQRHLLSWKDSGGIWSKVIEHQPVGRAYYYRSDYFMKVGRYGEAVADLQVSVKMAEEAGHPEIFTLYALLGESLRRAGRYEDAVMAMSQAIAMAPLPNFYYYRSLSLRQLGYGKDADADLEMAGGDQSPIVWQYLRNRDDLAEGSRK